MFIFKYFENLAYFISNKRTAGYLRFSKHGLLLYVLVGGPRNVQTIPPLKDSLLTLDI